MNSPPSIRRRNPRRQGETGLGAAIAWFCAQGRVMSIPLCDNQPHDIVVDDVQRLAEVQVETTTRRTPAGDFMVQPEANQGFPTRKAFDNTAVGYVLILTEEQAQRLVPASAISPKRAITMCGKYEHFRVR